MCRNRAMLVVCVCWLLYTFIFTFFYLAFICCLPPSRLKNWIPDTHATWLYIFRATLLVHSKPRLNPLAISFPVCCWEEYIRNVLCVCFWLYIAARNVRWDLCFFLPCNITECVCLTIAELENSNLFETHTKGGGGEGEPVFVYNTEIFAQSM